MCENERMSEIPPGLIQRLVIAVEAEVSRSWGSQAPHACTAAYPADGEVG